MGSRIYYLRDNTNIRTRKDGTPTRGNPKVCIVSEFNAETKEVKYGVSALHPKDHFDKKLARKIAADRLTTRPIVVETEAARGHEINKAVIEDIADQYSPTNTQIKKLANLWLSKSKMPLVAPTAIAPTAVSEQVQTASIRA
jgi:hypothetical protein